MPNQVNKQTHCTPYIKPSFQCSIMTAAFSWCFLLFPLLSVSVIVLAHLSICCFIFTHCHLCPSCLLSLFPFPCSPPLFFLFTVHGEILVSTVPPAPPLGTSSLGGWGSQQSFRPCRETRLVLLGEVEGSERVAHVDVLWELDNMLKWWAFIPKCPGMMSHKNTFSWHLLLFFFFNKYQVSMV